mgnify:CR=1 FL=1
MLYFLSILFGGFVGFALGLTGGGGSLLAVPLLVYGLSMVPREAFGVSLAAVGSTALVGVIPRIRTGQVELGTGLLFALAGMLGAPVGTWIAGRIPEAILLAMFSLLMLLIASRMWSKSAQSQILEPVCDNESRRPSCERTEEGTLLLTSRCAVVLLMVGLLTGVLSGMFGIGGGFVIVPALVLFSNMPIHRAVATSLLVIVLVSISGVASHFAAGRGISLEITGLFALGGVFGMTLGARVARSIPPASLQKVFATGIVTVALFIVSKTFM